MILIYSRGDTVDVLYKPSSPEQAKIWSFFSLWSGVLVAGILGLVFFLIGFFIILLGYKNNKGIESLKLYGTRVSASLQEVRLNTSLKVNGKMLYQVIALWQNLATGKVHEFSSKSLWFDPSEYIGSETIEVLVDKKNPEDYYVDTDFLPDLAS